MNTLLASIEELYKQEYAEIKMTLEDGDKIDNYDARQEDYEAQNRKIDWRTISDEYLQKYYCGITYLDQKSWNGYLPVFLGYCMHHYADEPGIVIETFLWNLRPHCTHFYYLKQQTPEVQQLVARILEFLGLESSSQFKDEALQILQEIDDYDSENGSD